MVVDHCWRVITFLVQYCGLIQDLWSLNALFILSLMELSKFFFSSKYINICIYNYIICIARSLCTWFNLNTISLYLFIILQYISNVDDKRKYFTLSLIKNTVQYGHPQIAYIIPTLRTPVQLNQAYLTFAMIKLCTSISCHSYVNVWW